MHTIRRFGRSVVLGLREASLAVRGTLLALVTLGGVALAGGTAYAQTTTTVDPTGGAAEEVSSGAQSWISAHGMPLLVVLLLIGITIALLLMFSRKGVRAAKSG